jgi:hypothetical protein
MTPSADWHLSKCPSALNNFERWRASACFDVVAKQKRLVDRPTVARSQTRAETRGPEQGQLATLSKERVQREYSDPREL